MNFSKSQRKLHSHNYNPPSNAYNVANSAFTGNKISCLEADKFNKILTGSLAGPTLLSDLLLNNKNTFGYSSRFQKNIQNIQHPGPGAYQALNSLPNKNSEKKKQLNSNIVKGNFYAGSGPSIPYSYYGQNPDQQQEQYIKQLLMNSNIDESHKKIHKSSAAFSFTKSAKVPSYIKVPTSLKKDERKVQLYQGQQHNQDSLYTKNYVYQQQFKRKQDRSKTSTFRQEKIKQANNRRLEVIQMISNQYTPSLELIQIMKKRKNKQGPGPTDYHPQGYTKQYVLTKKNKKNTPSLQQLQNQQQINSQNQNYNYNQKDHDNLKKKPQEQQQQYQYYEIISNKKGVSFPNTKRFKQYDKIDKQIGPGHYQYQRNQDNTFNSAKNLYNAGNKYSFGKGSRKVFQGKDYEGEFRYYIEPEAKNNIKDSKNINIINCNDTNNNGIIYKGGSLYQNPYNNTGNQIIKNSNSTTNLTTNRLQSSPFGSSTVRFSSSSMKKQDNKQLKLSLEQQKQTRNKQKLNKMIRSRMILQRKLGIDKDQKDQGLLNISTIASTID